MGIIRTDRVSGLGGANAIKGSVNFGSNDSNNYDTNLAFTNASDLDIGAGNFTIEYWFNCVDTTSGGFNTSIATSEYTNLSANNAFNIYHQNKGFNVYNRTGGGFTQLANPTDKWTPEKWHHFAWVRSGTSTNENAIYLDGVSLVTFTNALNYTSGQHWLIGANFYTGSQGYGSNPQYGFSGHLSNVRVSNVARYSGAFTPPKAEFVVDSNTILLACQSPSNILQEATEKEVTFYKGYLASSPPLASRFTPNSPVGFSTTTDVGTQFGTTFDGVTTFDSQAYMVPPGGNARERNRGRGLHAGGEAPSHSNIIDFIQIQSGGIAQDFGDLITLCNSCDGVASKTRAVFCTFDSPNFNLMEFVTIASTGNGTSFGEQTVSTGQEGSTNNDTIGLFAGGYQLAFFNHIEKITIATAGNAVDFGDLINPVVGLGGAADTTRGVFAGGVQPGNSYTNIIQKVEFATTADATDFGDLTVGRRNPAGTSDSTRGIFAGGNTNTPTNTGLNTIDFITIQTLGNAVDFGDMPREQADASGTSDSIRGVFSAGYYGSPHLSNVIEKVIIQSTGNAVDYGDLSVERIQGGSVSDSHGGLS
tara:strand:- start:1115 stop:2881 length:1767 start_codon:yes stop_codon:yes gene_type:complete